MIGDESTITIGLAVMIASGIAALWWRIEVKISAERDQRNIVARELNDYRLHVERHFVSAATLEKTEKRLILAFDHLSNRVETLISRMEILSNALAMATSLHIERK